MDQMEQLQKWIDQSSRIVFFGGAGVSTESGIPDFRSADGLYHQQYCYPPETVISRSFYDSHPREFFAFYRDKMLFPEARPNAAHDKLAELERAGKLSAIVTQNIDGLHQLAGSKTVFELHGSVHRNTCRRCCKQFELTAILHATGVPRCGCGGEIKPAVVLYEECLDEEVMRGAIRAISAADLLLVGGTSLAVYPAAGMVDYFQGERLVVINKTATPLENRPGLFLQGSIGAIMKQIKL